MILRSLKLKNFTVFRQHSVEFGRNLNVIVGENGSGKTHLLKLAYSAIAASAALPMGPPGRQPLQIALANKLSGVFRPDALGRLVRRAVGRAKCTVACHFDEAQFDLAYEFSRLAKHEVALKKTPSRQIPKPPVYLPTRELLTISPGFVSLYETTHLPFEETWRDTCLLLGAPLARGPREASIRELLKPLEAAMGGKILSDKSGRFYLNLGPSGTMEMHLVAEGLRKLATLARLIATGALLDTGFLFWDEPEANLNPKIVKIAARTILKIAEKGIQVFVATHSLFLLRELHLLTQEGNLAHLDARYLGLHLQSDGSVDLKQGPSMDDIGSIAALDEDLLQSDRYLESQFAADGQPVLEPKE